ncbi:MAG: 2-hydroxyacyl-CoA dehydratase family protein [Thermodesulfobacteriota bacterium]
MNDERLARLRHTTGMRLAMEESATLAAIEGDFAGNPQGMGYFYDLFRQGRSLLAGAEPLVGTTCIQVPEELIYAVGARPLRLCSGASAHEQVGAELLPAKACPLVKATCGRLALLAPEERQRLALVAVPTTCDQKRKTGELLAADGWPVHSLAVPPASDTEEAHAYWYASIGRLLQRLEEATGNRASVRSLQAAIAKVEAARGAFRRLHALAEARPPVLLGKDALLVASAYQAGDINRWTRAVHELCTELEARVRAGQTACSERAPRLLLAGSPPLFPNLKVPLLLEKAGAVLVGDEACSSCRLLYDRLAFDEAARYDLLPAVADRYLKPCACPCLTPDGNRLRRLTAQAQRLAADGVVYLTFAGCHLFAMEQGTVGSTFAGLGLPMLAIETDFSPEDTGQLSTRVEAFIESIRARKRRRA